MKKIFTVFSLILTIFVFASCTNADVISKSTAKEKALAHAKVSKEDATFAKASLEKDDGIRIYDVEFYANNAEYEYEIDAKSGKIISFDVDVKDQNKNDTSNKENVNSADNDNGGEDVFITKEKALEIALSNVSGATEKDARVEKDYDDGKLYYDVTVIYDNKEYEFEIDAKSGVITERDVDSVLND